MKPESLAAAREIALPAQTYAVPATVPISKDDASLVETRWQDGYKLFTVNWKALTYTPLIGRLGIARRNRRKMRRRKLSNPGSS